MIGWHHRLNGHGFGWTPVVGNGQGGLACCCSWDHRELDMTEQNSKYYMNIKPFFPSRPVLVTHFQRTENRKEKY